MFESSDQQIVHQYGRASPYIDDLSVSGCAN
jgi:hypothetical protein